MKRAYLTLLNILLAWTLTQSALLAQDKEQVAREFLLNQAGSNGFALEDFAEMRLSSRAFSQQSGLSHFYFMQQSNGIDIYNAIANVHIDDQDEVLTFGNRFVQNLTDKVTPKPELITPSLTALEAIQAAAERLGLPSPSDLKIIEDVGGAAQAAVFEKGNFSLENIPVKLVWQPLEGGELRLAWDLSIYELSAANWWSVRIDAQTGEILDQTNWVVHCNFGEPHTHTLNPVRMELTGFHERNFHFENDNSPAEPPVGMVGAYNVLPPPVESPIHGSRQLLFNPADPIASPFGWHDTDGVVGAEFTTTRGNNVFAQVDDNANNDEVGFMPDGGAGLNFDFPFNQAQDPNGYHPALVTNLFFWNNYIHDFAYKYGFDEESGNFQANNYGNGGLGDDFVYADALDGSGTNNANFGTPPDGQRPRMQMFRFTLTNPHRDSDFDNGVIAHEYAHGISIRLTGGPANVGCLNNSEQMGEGWSDYYAMMTTFKPGSVGSDVRGMGTYVLGQGQLGGGIRPAPYTTDMTINTYTYSNISSLAVPHGVGFLWCTMLWDMTWALIEKHGEAAGFDLAMNLVTEGMKLQPCSPGFVDGRNAILAADLALNGGANQCVIWGAFARRGLGFSATQGSSNNTSDGTQAFDLPTTCMGITPGHREVCQPTSATYTVTAPSAAAAPVNLSATGHPAGTTAGFSPNPVAPGATSTLTIGNMGAAAMGNYNLTITGNDGTTTFTAFTSLEVDGTTLAASLTAPANGATNVYLRPAFTWNAIVGVEQYCIQVATDNFFTNVVYTICDLTAVNSYTPLNTLSDNTLYYARLLGLNSCGTVTGNPISFTTGCAGSAVAPTLISPANSAANVYLTPTLTWSDIEHATTYDVELATDAAFTNIIASATGQLTTSFNVTTPLTDNTTYHWRAKANNLCGKTTSAAFSFTTNCASFTTPPVLTAPANGATNVFVFPTLTWNAAAAATSYTLEVATDAAFSNIVVNATGLTGTSYNFASILSNNTTYYWRVGTVNLCGTFASAALSFTTGTFNISCNITPSPDVPVAIPNTPAVRESYLDIPICGTVVDVNVLNLNISHTYVQDMTIQLISPTGTVVNLLSMPCGNQNNILINLDDEATNAYGTFPCPPTNNGTYRPSGTLADFDGENAVGNWILRVNDPFNQDGGAITAWSLQLCIQDGTAATVTCYLDSDSDTYGTLTRPSSACSGGCPANYVSNSLDCNDGDATINPLAVETCDFVDEDCDGTVDEGFTYTVCYRDVDTDGFGDAADSENFCGSCGTGYVLDNTDCDDTRMVVNPSQTEVCDLLDNDCDTNVDEGFDLDNDTYTPCSGDCDETDAAINPGATEVCDNADNNCDGVTDFPSVATYNSSNVPVIISNGSPPIMITSTLTISGATANMTDLNVNLKILHSWVGDLKAKLTSPDNVVFVLFDRPGRTTSGAGCSQNNILATFDDGATLTAANFESTCNPSTMTSTYAISGDYQSVDLLAPLNGTSPNGVWTLTVEDFATQDGGTLEEWSLEISTPATLATYYADTDDDSYGDPTNPAVLNCTPLAGSGFVSDNTDCDDTDPDEFPGQTWYKDGDSDGYSDGTSLTQCEQPANHYLASDLTANTGDCNDSDNQIHPAATEVCNGFVDDDCDGLADIDDPNLVDNEPPTLTCRADTAVFAGASGCSMIVNFEAPQATDNCSQPTSQTFSFTGSVQSFTVPPGVTSINIQAWGAQGGANWVNNTNFGGFASGNLAVTPGEVLHIYVGGQPTTISGGWNGGGAGDGAGKGGGGASDVRQGGTTLNDRKIVGAGAGGAGYWSNLHVVGGIGGGLTGGDGYRNTTFDAGGKGATQTGPGPHGTCVNFNVTNMAGSFGQGGTPLGFNCGCEGYGGGGGWYGGAGSGNCRGGGGGSSYIGGVANGTTTGGVRVGHGEVIISWNAPNVNLTVTQIAGMPSGSAFPVGTTVNTFRAEDGSGNADTCSFSVTVADTTAPTAVCKNYTEQLDGNGQGSIAPADVYLSGNDNCGTVNLQSVSPNSFNCNNLGTNTVTLTVNDGNGNSSTCTATVTVQDNVQPSVTCKSYTIALGANGTASVGPADIFLSGSDNCGTVNPQSVSPNSFNCNNLGANTVTLTVNDGYGNTNTCTATVTVQDNTKPIVICKNYTASLGSNGTVSVAPANVFLSGSDNCGTVNPQSVSPNSFNCSHIGPQTVTLTVNDGKGNTATCSATVTVQDVLAPTAKCKNVLVNLNAAGTASITPAHINNGSFDNCGTLNLVSVSPNSFTCSNIGNNTVTLTVNDGKGNTKTCTGLVVVQDKIAPSVTCKNHTVTLESNGMKTIAPADVFLSGSDNCGTVNLQSVTPSSLSCNHIGNTTVTLTVNDGKGNTKSCTATVTVNPFVTITNIAATNESCTGAGNGSIVITATTLGGTLVYSINGGASYSSSNIFSNLPSGTYSIKVLALGTTGCAASGSATLGADSPPQTWYKDVDNDGFSDGVSQTSCTQPTNFKLAANLTATSGDCNDNDPLQLPGQTWHKDADNDGYSDGATLTQCAKPAGYKHASQLTATTGDCNDANGGIHPAATEVCNSLDDDCDGQVDEGLANLTYVGNVSFFTQSSVDAWNSCYTVIQGNLLIQGTGIDQLAKLSNLQKVTGNVTIKISGLDSLSWLLSLDTIGGTLTINSNTQLKTLDGLDNLARVGGALKIFQNYDLTDCCAIYDLLNTIGGVGGAVSIYSNDTGCDNVSQINTACDPSFSGGAGSNSIEIPPVGGNSFASGAMSQGIQISPNPASEVVELKMAKEFQAGKLRLFDLQGRVLAQQDLEVNSLQHRLPVNELRPGAYLLVVYLDGEIYSEKLVVE